MQNRSENGRRGRSAGIAEMCTGPRRQLNFQGSGRPGNGKKAEKNSVAEQSAFLLRFWLLFGSVLEQKTTKMQQKSDAKKACKKGARKKRSHAARCVGSASCAGPVGKAYAAFCMQKSNANFAKKKCMKKCSRIHVMFACSCILRLSYAD